MRAIPIGEASRRSRINIETIRYYERIGLVPKPARSAGGRRHYTGDQVRRLAFIKRARELGFGLATIRALLALVEGGRFTCSEVHAMVLDHLGDVGRKIEDLQRIERVLEGMAAQCSRGDLPQCPIVEALFDN